jgi:dienelactone hydrolase
VLFNHGSGHASGVGANGVPDHHHPEILGPLFVRHGYAFLYLFRRGDGLSRDQGTGVADEMDRAAAQSQEARNRVQAERIQNEDLIDALAGLAALRARPEIDPRRLAVVGHSFGGSLSVLVAERDSTLRAAVLFSAGGYSYDRSSELRRLLLTAVDRARMPLFFIHARNDYSIAAAESLGAEMARLGKPHQVKIYPPIGRTADEGHDFIHSGVSVWEGDVFAFLDPLMKR